MWKINEHVNNYFHHNKSEGGSYQLNLTDQNQYNFVYALYTFYKYDQIL